MPNKIISFFKSLPLDYLALFILSFCLFLYFGYSLSFADPDSFYHVKMAQLIAQQGAVLDFPWQQFTLLKDNFIDHHFLYHLFLIPFISFGSPLIGAKIATIFLASAFLVLFYFFLKNQQIKWPWLWSLLLLFSTSFTFRLNLTKASAFSLIFLWFGFYLLRQRRPWSLAILAFAYVWSYGGFTLLLVVSSIYCLGLGLKEKNWRLAGQLLSATIGGLLTGLIVNPYFPKNLQFLWQQLIQIGLLNYQDKIGVGAEWYPYNFFTLLSDNLLLGALLLISLFIFFRFWSKQSAFSWTTFILFLFFFLFTLKSRRYIEYLIPLAVLFAALCFNYLPRLRQTTLFNSLARLWPKNIFFKIIVLTTVFYLCLFLPVIFGQQLQATKNNLRQGLDFNRYQAASQWLQNNTQPGEIIVHSDWDDWPLLFYYNSQNYYLVGLDPTFMYNYNQDLYWSWVNLTLGRPSASPLTVIKDQFQSHYILVDQDNSALNSLLAKDPLFQLVYSDALVLIYQAK